MVPAGVNVPVEITAPCPVTELTPNAPPPVVVAATPISQVLFVLVTFTVPAEPENVGTTFGRSVRRSVLLFDPCDELIAVAALRLVDDGSRPAIVLPWQSLTPT